MEKFSRENAQDPIQTTQAFAAFMGQFGQATNSLSFILSLLGTSFVIQRLGLRTTLILFPVFLLAACVVILANQSLYTVFLMMLVLKALSYALNNPCKELLYQTTNNSVKFKAKSWIDIFGQRSAKALGSVVTDTFSDSAEALLSNGMVLSIGLSGILILISRWIGQRFDHYTESGYKVGDLQVEVEVIGKEDTSCGLEEEGSLEEELTAGDDKEQFADGVQRVAV